MIRRLLERISRTRAFMRRLPDEFGRAPLYVSADAQLKFLRPGRIGLDAMLLDRVAEWITPEMRVWDIGANVGVFAVASAARNARVLALEPDPWLAALLRRSAALAENRHLDLWVLCAAASDHNGTATLQIAGRGRASNALEGFGGSQMGGVRERNLVPTLTMDTLMASWRRPDFVKIDVEGAEGLVLAGAARLLTEARPMFMIEVEQRRSATLAKLFAAYAYRLFDAEQPSQGRAPLTHCPFSTLALPAECFTDAESGAPQGKPN